MTIRVGNSIIAGADKTKIQRNIGEIVTSTIPLVDAELHLLDGSLIQGSGIYSDFVTYMAGLVSTNPEIFAQEYVSETSAGSAISGGDYSGQPKGNAFDGNTTTFWGSSQLGAANILGTAYIGKSGLSKPVKKVRLYQGHPSYATNYCSQLLFQYSNDGSTWIDIDAITNGADKTWQEWILPDYTPNGSTHSFRVLAYGGFAGGSGNNWIVDELELYYLDINSETAWQTSNTNYGACDKFVYDSVNNTVRLPKRTTEHGALIKSFFDGVAWFRIYSDGWCEQGNLASAGSSNINLVTPFRDAAYDVLAVPTGGTGTRNYGYVCTNTKTASSFKINETTSPSYNWWVAYGYVDISDYQYSPVYEYIVIATSVKTQIEVDIDEIATDLNGKADVDLGNINNTGTSKGASWAMPSGTSVTLTMGASGTDYTAPANGWFALMGTTAASANSTCQMDTSEGLRAKLMGDGHTAMGCGTFIPIKANSTMELGYYNFTVSSLKFIYAEGEPNV